MARERYLLNAGEDTIHQNEIKLVTGKDKRKNWWYYHKVHLLVGIIVVGLVGSFIYSMVTKVNPDYTIGLLTSYSMPSNGLDQLEKCITPYADDRNGDGQVVVTVVNYVYSDDADADATQQQAAVVRFLADASSNTCMIYLHDQEAFDALSRSDFGGLFQYNDGTAMPEDADDFENAMLSWDEIPALAKFVPQTEEGDMYTADILTQLYERLRVSCRAAEGSSIERSEKDMAYHQSSLELLERLKNDTPITGETATEEG